MRKVGSAGTVPAIDLDRLISMIEAHILWPAVKLKDVNHSQKVKDELDRGEWQGIMAGSG